MRVERTVATPDAEVRRCDDGIIEVRWREGAVVELAEIDAVLDAQRELRVEPSGVLVDSRPVRSMTREAQQRTANHPNNQRTLALAILISSPVSTLLGNFFMTLSRPPYPTRLFRDESEARRWLLDRLDERAR